MARYARLLGILVVLCLSTSAFATIMDAVPDTENDDMFLPTVLDLTIGRVAPAPWADFGFGLMTSDTDVDFFKVELVDGDYLMVNTSIINPTLATVVTLYDDTGSPVAGGTDAAAYIDNVIAADAGIYYIGVTGTGSAAYMMTAAIENHLPEPATLAFLAIGGAAVLIRRRRNG